VIDPVLAYSTYLGGSFDEAGYGIAVDNAGGAYLTGFTDSTDFPRSIPSSLRTMAATETRS
jgi:Beta-propeller repeat